AVRRRAATRISALVYSSGTPAGDQGRLRARRCDASTLHQGAAALTEHRAAMDRGSMGQIAAAGVAQLTGVGHTPAAPPSARGSCAASIVPSACSTAAPA